MVLCFEMLSGFGVQGSGFGVGQQGVGFAGIGVGVCFLVNRVEDWLSLKMGFEQEGAEESEGWVELGITWVVLAVSGMEAFMEVVGG